MRRGAVGHLPGIVRGTGSDAAVVVTDAALAATPVIAAVTGVLEAAGIPVAVFSGVHDLEARAQMLLAAHMAGIGMATTGLGLCHAIGHSLGGRFDIAHGVALTMLLPAVLRYNAEVSAQRLADVAFALGVGEPGRDARWNADAAIAAITDLAGRLSLTQRLGDLEITGEDFAQIAADALDDEVLANTPRPPAAADIHAILLAC